ncbi:MAG: TIGR03087 family PEP-CTERM/XrtA system glycosyltransferase [Burkholderiaceae bacterium]
MEPLLLLMHRIPFPPNKGDKITNFEILRYFAQRYEIYLGTFIDDPRDEAHVDTVREFCREAHFERIDARWARLASARGLLNGSALTLTFYSGRRLRRWSQRVAERHSIRSIFVSSTAMYQFVPRVTGAVCVVHYHDLDSDKWRQYASTKAWPLSAVYRREWRTLLAYERFIARDSNAALFVTPSEADFFRTLAPESAHKVHWPGHGLDHDYYRPASGAPSPYPDGASPILFVGVMDYWPNEDAAIWYAREIHPLVRAANPNASFYVVGMNPTRRVQELAALPGVFVTGQVPDVRPWFQHAAVVVAPLRIARGIQNKALQAMAMQRPVVMSRMSAASLSARAGEDIEVADTALEFADEVAGLLRDRGRGDAMGERARARIERDYSWQRTMQRIDALLTTKTKCTC